jgi:glycosyltransferase involved in cell wall biosynthesis
LFWFVGASDEVLNELYKCASGFLMASEAEGFGLPIVEAASYKLPILARDIPIFREVGQDHISYFSGMFAEDLAKPLQTFIENIVSGSVILPGDINVLNWKESSNMLLDVIVNKSWFKNWRPVSLNL